MPNPTLPCPHAPVRGRGARILAAALALGALATSGCGGGAASGTATPPADTPSVTLLEAVPNPTGLQVGFWEVFNQQAATLGALGKRPTSRVGFDAWAALEPSPGTYSFGNAQPYKAVHAYGETILAAVNISFSSQVTPGKQTIPAFYPNRITDPTTRAAAKAFLRAYVQWLLQQVGSAVLTIDYEIMSNYRLSAPGSEALGAEWGAWYVEAAAVARQAAADLGKADQLKLQPILNGDPFDAGNPIALGPAHNGWLVDVVKASDSLALDTYHSDPALPVTDPARTLAIIQFWIDTYAAGKDVMVTENGFTTITEKDPAITRENRDMKLTGTEAQQATYFSALFPRLLQANRKDGIFHNQLRAFNIWSITDNTVKPVGSDERYFGLLRDDGSAKPALAAVQTAVAGLEADPFHQPATQNGSGIDVTDHLASGPGVGLAYRSGNAFQFLRYREAALPSAARYTLQGEVASAGSILVHVNETAWFYAETTGTFAVDVSSACRPGQPNVIDIYCTGPVFPFQQTVRRLTLVKS